MELCRYGSLHTLLDSPENGYGVAEETFLLILKHVGTVFNHNSIKNWTLGFFS